MQIVPDLLFPSKGIHVGWGEKADILKHSGFISVIYWSLDSREIFWPLSLSLSFYLQSDVIAEAE